MTQNQAKPVNTHTIIGASTALIFGLITYSTAVMAHQDASDPQFCADGEMVQIGTMNITGSTMSDLLQDKPVDCPVGIKDVKGDTAKGKELRDYVGGVLTYRNIYKRHDFFDETPARLAYAYASCLCASMVNDEYDPNKVRPLLTGPEILLSESHHMEYDLTDGLEFSCQVCQARD